MSENYEFESQEMFEPIERMFEREYPSSYGFFVHHPRMIEMPDGAEPVDLLFVAGTRDSVHVVKIEESYDDGVLDFHGGIHTMANVPGNFRWVALPLDAFYDGEQAYSDIMQKTCKDRGLGIITIQPKGRGISAKIFMGAKFQDGDFLANYEGVHDKWNELAGDEDLARAGYQVVDYYD